MIFLTHYIPAITKYADGSVQAVERERWKNSQHQTKASSNRSYFDIRLD